MIKQTEILVIGGGPAGLSAACAAAELGASVLLCERDYLPGGQLVKQTQKFWSTANTLKKSAATSHVRKELKSWI